MAGTCQEYSFSILPVVIRLVSLVGVKRPPQIEALTVFQHINDNTLLLTSKLTFRGGAMIF